MCYHLRLVLEYLDRAGSSPFADWFHSFNAAASGESDDGAARLGVGKLLERKRVGGVSFGKDGDAVVILLCGGTKKRQDRDIAMAHERWVDYKKRKGEEK